MDGWELDVRESVRQTLADYTAATDRFDLRALAACFAEDGVLEFTGGAEPLRGPEEIEAGLGAAIAQEPGSEGRAQRMCAIMFRVSGSSRRPLNG
jgi:ketosteroid isomerase-like protein